MRSPFTFLIVFFLHILLSTISTSKFLCTEKEKQALLDFKLSFVDPFDVLSSWSNANGDCCNWDGVGCDNYRGHVTSLWVGGPLISYKLRPSLVELQHLTSLDLNGNQFTTRIPDFIGSLSKLTYLDLSYTGFYGEIPPHLGNLSKLKFLDLSDGSSGLYTGNLQWLTQLPLIEYVDLSNVNLANAVDWLSTLKMLPSLSSFHCDSCSLPQPLLSSISHVNLTSFRSIDLSNNSVSYSTFSHLNKRFDNLKRLSLNDMKSANLREFLEAMNSAARYSLVWLHLAGNNLTKLPFEVLQFPSLQSMDVSSNKISMSLSEILQYLPINMTDLYISSNFIRGVISDSDFFMFSQLYALDLSYNNLLKFNFSKSWLPPFQLQELYLSSCRVGPNFPNWILTQKKLWKLDISNSMIYGDIPNNFWNSLTQISSLNLSHNIIDSEIPNLPMSLDIIEMIDLSYNKFYGRIPRFLFSASILDLSNNKFSSFPTLHPRVLGSGLSIINFSSNNLSGLLPSWLFQYVGLGIINLDNNNLSGTLPEAIGSLRQLYALHLSNNKFSGELPSSMRNCTKLTILELSNNNFSGVVPTWIGASMTWLVVLTLRSNDFYRELPSSICQLQSLQILDLSGNRLSGTIPSCLYNFSSMATNKDLSLISYVDTTFVFYTNGTVLALDFALVMWKGALTDLYSRNLEQRNVINLSGNMLRGEIPIGLTTLKELKSLDLSRNDLNGSIPDKIGELTNLEELKLSSNRLCGEIPESLADLTFLGTLNLSNNNLSGRIPTSTQLQGFDASSYAGNPKLCGQPLLTKCPGDANKLTPSDNDAHDKVGEESFDIEAFLAALGIGFSFGLLGVIGMLHFIRLFRVTFFQLVDAIADKVFVMTSLSRSRIERRLCFKKENGVADM